MDRSQESARRLRTVVGLTAAALLMGVAGCPADDPCAAPEQVGLTIVLTFDDGPLAADVELPVSPAARTTLLEPLHQILATLASREASGVFFVKGPGSAANAADYREEFAAGLLAIHDAGHDIGYHAFRHDPAIWVQPLVFPPLAQISMSADLDQLELYLHGLLNEHAIASTDVLTPIFRQPYGGAGLSRTPAIAAAAARGWTYRGYLVDSVDWTANSDVTDALVANLSFANELEQVAFVRSRLRTGVLRNAHRDVIDVLFHVNQFTAAHLPEWFDELTQGAQALGRGPLKFNVPTCYRERSDATVDLGFWIRG